MEMTDQISGFAKLCAAAASAQTMKSITLAVPRQKSDIVRIKYTQKLIGNRKIVQAEYSCTEGRLRHVNMEPDGVYDSVLKELPDFDRAELYSSGGSASFMRSKKGRETLIKKGSAGSGEKVSVSGNNREKNHILSGGEPFLTRLGISDKSGRVHDKMQPKFRQINRFLENIRDVYRKLPPEGVLYVADLCCGKSYLSFAAYYFLTNIMGRDCVMDCVDLKKSVIDDCAAIAADCRFDGMNFFVSDISAYVPFHPVHITVSLHACDTATDIVLDRAAALGSRVILSTPCCHRQLSHLLDCPELSFIADNSILKQKFCDAATDALRILRLKAMGYDAIAMELIDPEDTPKNVLIRAIKADRLDYGGIKLEKYRKAFSYLTGKEAPELPGMLSYK